ncbi:zinc finger protein JAGGED isoform X1 [Beta vulgaris subsp. vulgaris]|uniref:zinc finger protein JAGGED isoform X1 n=1 Tax=Beta vulgaris subsp. vulgaris TaxID=3555 RepID=UPI00203745C7|nr:zinc finger protein JAGGED isoform X1 [Beta vulgaris subsp. vulgaris]
MRTEGSPLDLNNLPEDYTRDGKQVVYEDTSTSERETETLNKARQLVYSSENPPSIPHHHPHSHLGSYVSAGAIYHQPPPPPPPVYPTRPIMFSGGASSTLLQQPHNQPLQYHHHQSCLYTTTTPPRITPSGDYYMAHGHALTGSSPTNYTCIGAPVGIPGLAEPPRGRDGLDTEDGLTSPY